MRDLIKQLESIGRVYREIPIDEERLARIDERVFSALDLLPKTHSRFPLRGLSLFVPTSVQMVLRPVAVFAFFMAVALGGWASVNAATRQILPGSPLYGLKLASERAHVSLAFNAGTRTELEFEMAGRRLDEAAKISESGRPNSAELTRATMEQFKNQMTTAQSKLQDLKSQNSSQAVSVAKAVDRKSTEYQALLDDTSTLGGQAREQVAEAKDIAQKTSFVAVTMLLEGQESGEVSEEEAQRKVGDKLRELESGLQLTGVRLLAIPADNYPEISSIGGPTLGSLKVDLGLARETLEHAKNLYAQGGLSAALTYYQQGIGFMNQLNWGAGLYEKTLEARSSPSMGEDTGEGGQSPSPTPPIEGGE